MKKITPCIWLDNQAEEAANFYISVFPNSKITGMEKYTADTPANKPVGSVLTVNLEIDGNEFMLLNGGPEFKLSEAVSFIIPCEDQKEMDYYYDKLSAVPESEVCGWLKDKYGVSWQLLPNAYGDIMKKSNDEQKKRMMESLLNMKRLDIAELEKAAGSI